MAPHMKSAVGETAASAFEYLSRSSLGGLFLDFFMLLGVWWRWPLHLMIIRPGEFLKSFQLRADPTVVLWSWKV
jgi:hypothetical protein